MFLNLGITTSSGLYRQATSIYCLQVLFFLKKYLKSSQCVSVVECLLEGTGHWVQKRPQKRKGIGRRREREGKKMEPSPLLSTVTPLTKPIPSSTLSKLPSFAWRDITVMGRVYGQTPPVFLSFGANCCHVNVPFLPSTHPLASYTFSLKICSSSLDSLALHAILSSQNHL